MLPLHNFPTTLHPAFLNTLKSTLIYVIDDDHDDFHLLTEVIVERWSTMRFEHFSDPQDFVRQLGTLEHPCFIVLDINMPKLDGFQVLSILKENVSWKRIPVIFLSTSSEPSVHHKALDLGAVSYLIKPSTSEQWEQVIREIRKISLVENC